MAAHERVVLESSNSLNLYVVPGVNAPLTLAGGTLLGAKGQSNQFHLAKTGVKGSVCVCVFVGQCRYLVQHIECRDSLWAIHKWPISYFFICFLASNPVSCFFSRYKVMINLFCPKESTFPIVLFSLCMSQDNRLIGALKQPEAWNEARRGVQSQRYTRIRREKSVEKKERKKEGRRDNEETKMTKREPKQRTNMILKQTNK